MLWLLPVVVLAAGGAIALQRRRRRGRRLYQQELERALADGILTEEEARELANVREERDLTAAEVRMVAISLYRRALREAMADARITEQEDESLQRMRDQLGLSDADLAADVKQLQRIRLFAGVERGELPKTQAPIDTADGEVCHFALHGRLADLLMVPGKKADLRAIVFDVTGTAPFSVSGERSALGPSPDILPVDIGLTVITNRRTVFKGARRSVSIPHKNLRTIDLFQDGIALDERDPAHTSFLMLNDPELTAAILLVAARTRQQELKNLSTRTA